MTAKAESTAYINQCRRAYSLYVMEGRSLPTATDGLKTSVRRALWTARDGKKYKSATLAGATMPIHPHQSPEGAINTIAAQYGNNIPLLTGDSAFGTLLTPTEYSASRYTSVTASKFTQDVVYVDLDIVPIRENYDGTLDDPVHFLPLIPLALLNPTTGIAIGYATTILPRGLDDIINAQITHLKGNGEIKPLVPKFYPLKDQAVSCEPYGRGMAHYFNGTIEIKDTSTLTITKIPFWHPHEAVINTLDALVANEESPVVDYEDGSKDVISIVVKFKRGYLKTANEADLLKMLNLSVRHIEHLNVLDFTGKAVWNTNPVDLIRKYTDWRLGWYVKRYERLRDLLNLDLQRYYDIRTAIKNNVGGVAKKTSSRAELREYLETIQIVHTDYIADLPVYRFTEEEYQKNEKRIAEAEAQLKLYEKLLGSEDERKTVYIAELQEVLTKFKKGVYEQ